MHSQPHFGSIHMPPSILSSEACLPTSFFDSRVNVGLNTDLPSFSWAPCWVAHTTTPRESATLHHISGVWSDGPIWGPTFLQFGCSVSLGAILARTFLSFKQGRVLLHRVCPLPVWPWNRPNDEQKTACSHLTRHNREGRVLVHQAAGAMGAGQELAPGSHNHFCRSSRPRTACVGKDIVYGACYIRMEHAR
jgi:hypothetical protein